MRRQSTAEPPKQLLNYPRYSGSLWDLVARCIALSLSDAHVADKDELRPYADMADHCASAARVCAIIDHRSGGKSRAVTRLGTAEIIESPSRRGVYVLNFSEDILGSRTTSGFRHTPGFMRFSDLLMRASLMHLYRDAANFPGRPKLHVPVTFLYGGERYINPDALPEPSRTAFRRWMLRENLEPFEVPSFKGPLMEEDAYFHFLRFVV